MRPTGSYSICKKMGARVFPTSSLRHGERGTFAAALAPRVARLWANRSLSVFRVTTAMVASDRIVWRHGAIGHVALVCGPASPALSSPPLAYSAQRPSGVAVSWQGR